MSVLQFENVFIYSILAKLDSKHNLTSLQDCVASSHCASK